MPSVALLANPDSGQGESERVEELLRRAGARVETFAVGDWRKAACSGAERIVVAGGDGSIACAAQAASEAGVPLAVVATGTANDFAAGLALPSDLEQACELAACGERTLSMELGRVGDRHFVNIASVGLSPAAAEHADDLKDRIGALAYPVGALKAGLTAKPIRCRVLSDGVAFHEGEAWQVSVASTGAFGGGASLETNTSDGKLDLVVMQAAGRARLAKHAYGMRVGNIEGQRGVLDTRCKSVELRLEEPGECLNVDGELVDAEELAEDGTIHFGVEDGAFELIVG